MEGGEEVVVTWRGHRIRAFVPVPLARRTLDLSGETVARTAAAVAQVQVSAETMPAEFEPLARLLLRAEGVASSYIEGVTAPLADIVLAEKRDVSYPPAAWVAANLAAVAEAVRSAHDEPFSVAMLCGWHRTLMAGSPTPDRYVGVIRQEQGWIGGTSPLDAALVTPPAPHVPALLDDLAVFVNRSDLDPIVQAAVAHAQVEVIHPFGDGNGRVGRVLVSWLLARRLSLLTPPPVSARIAADRDGYLSGLALFRLGQHEPWIRWFAETVSGAGRAQRALIEAVGALESQWRRQLGQRAVHRDGVAWEILDLLPRHLVLSAALVAEHTGRGARAARGGLGALVDAGILIEHVPAGARRPGRPGRLFVSPDLLGLAGTRV